LRKTQTKKRRTRLPTLKDWFFSSDGSIGEKLSTSKAQAYKHKGKKNPVPPCENTIRGTRVLVHLFMLMHVILSFSPQEP